MRVLLLVPALFLSGCLMQQPVAVVPEPVQVKPAAAKPAPQRVQATRPAPKPAPTQPVFQGGEGEAGGWDG